MADNNDEQPAPGKRKPRAALKAEAAKPADAEAASPEVVAAIKALDDNNRRMASITNKLLRNGASASADIAKIAKMMEDMVAKSGEAPKPGANANLSIAGMALEMAAGVPNDSPERIQFYLNNKDAIEKVLQTLKAATSGMVYAPAAGFGPTPDAAADFAPVPDAIAPTNAAPDAQIEAGFSPEHRMAIDHFRNNAGALFDVRDEHAGLTTLYTKEENPRRIATVTPGQIFVHDYSDPEHLKSLIILAAQMHGPHFGIHNFPDDVTQRIVAMRAQLLSEGLLVDHQGAPYVAAAPGAEATQRRQPPPPGPSPVYGGPG